MRAGVVFPDPLNAEEAPVQGDRFPWDFLVVHGMTEI